MKFRPEGANSGDGEAHPWWRASEFVTTVVLGSTESGDGSKSMQDIGNGTGEILRQYAVFFKIDFLLMNLTKMKVEVKLSAGNVTRKLYIPFNLHTTAAAAFTHEAVPKRILELMKVPGLTRENLASHLQECH